MCPFRCYLVYFAGDDPSDFRHAFDILDVLDADGDSKINLSDLKSTIITDNDIIASMISAANTDHNGIVDFDEFERVLGGGGGRDGREVMEDPFRVMD
ncbi:probable calcium-binding protein CML18 [Asparagus officinalis]|uniref:probable calcium-binding protein CML18 n=1 Tax=Asparagus officinalis TaxID=4686 RepID=UPI00098DEE88|nr:probable calcium-binding protein CML18 [Asparagus officinalis]